MASKKEETVRVCVRCRPLNSKEKSDGRERIVTMDPRSGTCSIIPPGGNNGELPKTFTFDQVYDESVTQEYIYMQTASRVVDSVLEGFNGTIFACVALVSYLYACIRLSISRRNLDALPHSA